MGMPGGPEREIRIGDAEREAAIQTLGQHLSSGHLDVNEYAERTGAAAAARTAGELDALFSDLPGPHQRPPLPPAPPAPMGPTPPGYPPARPEAPAGVDYYGRPLSKKNRWAAGILQLVFPFGVGRFYTGQAGIGIAQLLLFPIGVGALWCLIDGILLLARGGTDGQGRWLRE